jgi:alkyl hydroperoxide reductase subunit AhpC
MIAIGQKLPFFMLRACVSRNAKEAFQTISSDSFPNQWIVLFFWPNDFTPVCATEIRDFGSFAERFAEREAVVLGASVDSAFVHLAWTRYGEGPDVLPIPLLSDPRRDLVSSLGVLDAELGVAQRATLIVDPGKTIRHISVNDFSVGRNPRETLRLLDALQTDGLCPSSWNVGETTIPGVADYMDKLMPVTYHARPL